MLTFKESGWRAYGDSLYYSGNFLLSLTSGKKKKKLKKKKENSQNWKGYTSFIEELSSWLTLNLFNPTHRIVPGDFNIHTGDPPFNTLVFHFLDLLSSNESVLQLTSTTHPLNLLLPITPTLILSLKNRIPVPKQHLHLLFQLHWLTLPWPTVHLFYYLFLAT